MTYLTTSLASLASAKAIRLRDDDGGGGDDDDGEREERRKTVPSNDVDLSNALNSSPPPLQPLPPTRLLVPCLSPHTANRPPLDLLHFRSLSLYLSLCSNIPNRGEERRLPFVYSRRKQNNICGRRNGGRLWLCKGAALLSAPNRREVFRSPING